jgi:NAD-dependent dihydropyrimidine dehydrogenase PreA subunit
LYFTWRTGELVFRGYDPCYALISRHGEEITFWAYTVSGGIVVASLTLALPFCRWLCPLAAVFHPFSWLGLTRVKRDTASCIDCGDCARACPMGIKVDQVRQVTAARCTSCLDCVAACPQPAEGTLRWGPPRVMGGSWPQVVLLGLVFLPVGGAVAATYLAPLPSFVRTRGDVPASVESLSLRVEGPKCRHSTEQFVAWLERHDEYAIRGYLKVEAWPEPGFAPVRISFDPQRTSAAKIKRAICEPVLELRTGRITPSPYRVEGYNLLADE